MFKDTDQLLLLSGTELSLLLAAINQMEANCRKQGLDAYSEPDFVTVMDKLLNAKEDYYKAAGIED